MGRDQQSVNETPKVETRQEWQAPEILSVVPISETRGNGGAGFDFASEVSV